MQARKWLLVAGAVIAAGVAAFAVTWGTIGPGDAGKDAPSARGASSASTPTVEPSGLGALESTPVTSVDTSAAGTVMTRPGVSPLESTPVNLPDFEVARAMETVRALEAFGVRQGGSDAETRAAEYLRDRLVALGLSARIEEFPLSNGTMSRNVVARITGATDDLLVLGAHMDTKPPSPGANDNASGCGALLEIARLLAADPPMPTVEVVFFGTEEVIGDDPNEHHLGSRYAVSRMSAAQRARTVGMISIDMIGYGPALHSRTMGKGPSTLSDMLIAQARALGTTMTYRKDPGRTGWSDHEAYEVAGIPVSWIEWRDDPVYHTAGDTSAHLSASKIDACGDVVLEFVRGLDRADLDALLAR